MGILDFLQRKSSATTQAVVQMAGPSKAIYTPRNYADLAREGYTQNVYAFRAANTLAVAAAAIPFKLFQQGKKLTEVEEHPLIDLMNRPNVMQGGASFWRNVFLYWIMEGNSYIEAVMPSTRKAAPQELWALRPDRMKVIADAHNLISGYVYDVDGNKTTFDAATILHLKEFDPLSDFYGLSSVGVAGRAIDQHNAANNWNTALLQNSARPPGALVTQSSLTPEQREQLKRDIKTQYGGARNAGKPILLESGLDWKQMGFTPSDMDWLSGKTQAAREIAIAMGVPSELLGDAANRTYSNVQEARKALYSERVIPMVNELRDGLNNWLVPLFDPRLRLDIDISNIEALAEDSQVKRAFVMEAWQSSILTLNETRKELGFEELPQARGNVFFVPGTGAITPDDQLVADEEDTQDALPPPANILQLNPGTPPPAAPDGNDDAPPNTQAKSRAYKMLNLTTEQQKKAHWRDVETQREKWYDEVQGHVKTLLAEIGDNVESVVKYSVDGKSAQQRVPHLLASFRDDWTALYKATYTHVGVPFAKQSYNALHAKYGKKAYRWRLRRKDNGDSFDDSSDDDWSDLIWDDLSSDADTRIDSVNHTLEAAIVACIIAGLDDGLELAAIALTVKALFGDTIEVSNAERIAECEVTFASNAGILIGANAMGLDGLMKTWISMGDNHVRPTHQDADGQTVGVNEDFVVGDTTTDVPGNSGEADEDCGCRCTFSLDTSQVNI